MNRAHLLKKNLEKWSKIAPDSAEIIRNQKCVRTEFCESENGDLNLKIKKNGEPTTLCNKDDPVKEADRWKSTLNLNLYSVIYVYGVGLGYYYSVLSDWLAENSKRHLVFLESDPEILRRFFETEIAKEMLQNPSVRIYYIGDKESEKSAIEEIAMQFYSYRYKITALLDYLHHRSKDLIRLNTMLEYMLHARVMMSAEFNQMAQGFYINFYANLLFLERAKLAQGLYGCFKGVPAIICGAGPSFKKNIGMLNDLKNNALIIAGGTAINVLNAQGIDPHVGIGIDPHPDHAMRILTNTSHMIPFFYHSRMNHTALQILHGDLIYINGSRPYPITTWLEDQLGIKNQPINEGHNVVNLSLSLAHALGCSPIITVGVDLAYSEDQSYAPLTPNHPLNYPSPIFRTKRPEEELLSRTDINEKPVLTLWKWMQESIWYSQYLLDHPDFDLINATEGGIGFPGVNNMTLKEVKEKYLKANFDLTGLTHTLIQLSDMPKDIHHEAVIDKLNVIHDGLKHSMKISNDLSKAFLELKQEVESGKPCPKHYVNQKIMDLLIKYQDEFVYDIILYSFEKFYNELFTKEINALKINEHVLKKEEVDASRLDIHCMRYLLLNKVALVNSNIIEKSIDYIKKQTESHADVKTQLAIDVDQLIESYRKNYHFDEKTYFIHDRDLGITFDENLPPLGKEFEMCKMGLNGNCRMKQYFKDGKLHGPSRCYANDQLVSEVWYYHGSQVGRSVLYYPDGSLYAIKGVKDGKPHGDQLYFYQSGNLRAFIPYFEGSLEGICKMFYSNNRVKRHIPYKKGLLHGEEGLWTQDGKRIIEAHYKEAKPQGINRYFTQSGQLLKEVIFDEAGKLVALNAIDEEGKLVAHDLKRKLDIYDLATESTTEVTESLYALFNRIQGVIQLIEKDQGKKLKKVHDLELLKSEMFSIKDALDLIKSLEKELVAESEKGSSDTGEQIWKTPAAKELLKDKISQLSSALKQNFSQIEDRLKTILEPFIEKDSNQ